MVSHLGSGTARQSPSAVRGRSCSRADWHWRRLQKPEDISKLKPRGKQARPHQSLPLVGEIIHRDPQARPALPAAFCKPLLGLLCQLSTLNNHLESFLCPRLVRSYSH
jgi:hypothetical protein